MGEDGSREEADAPETRKADAETGETGDAKKGPQTDDGSHQEAALIKQGSIRIVHNNGRDKARNIYQS